MLDENTGRIESESGARPAVSARSGVVTAVSRDETHKFTKPNVDSIELIAGLGVHGDAHFGETVQHLVRVREDPTKPNRRQVHLIHGELHDELKALGLSVGPGEMGENITTRGLDLLGLPIGTRLHVGGRGRRRDHRPAHAVQTDRAIPDGIAGGRLARFERQPVFQVRDHGHRSARGYRESRRRHSRGVAAGAASEAWEGVREVVMNREQAALRAVFAGALCVGVAGAAVAAEPPLFSPNPAVGWISLSTDFTPPKTGAGPVQQDPRFPRVSNEEYRATGRQPTIAQGNPEAPILLPWAKEQLRKRNALVQSGKGGLSRQASCWPVGVPGFVLHVIHPIFLIQGPKEVVMVWQGDHVVRRVHLNVPHSRDLKPSWFGESVGHYEGDTLVVDTIGIDKRTYVDGYQTPHSEQLHVVERIRMVDGGKGSRSM